MTPLTRLVSQVTLPIAFLISMTHLVGAEAGPGDGFTAGIITALALTLEYEVFGYREVQGWLRRTRFEYLLLSGLGVALLAALLPLAIGLPLLGEPGFALDLPLLGDIKMTRALLFDIGIYLVVVGGAMTAVDSLRRHE